MTFLFLGLPQCRQAFLLPLTMVLGKWYDDNDLIKLST